MKLTVDRQILLIALLCWAFGIKCHAQGAVTSNPLEYAAIQQGEARINGQVKSQTDGMENLAGVQGTMVKEANIMKKWEKQYNAYLTGLCRKDSSGIHLVSRWHANTYPPVGTRPCQKNQS